MPIVARDVLDICRHALYHGDFSSEIDGYGVLNRAGDALVSCHSWSWLQRSGTVSLTADTAYADLPAGFAELIAYDAADGLNQSLTLTTLQRLVELRSSSVVSLTTSYYGAIVYAAQAGLTPPTPRLELYPTPTANATDAFSLFYRASWTELDEPDDPVEVPPFIEQLYIEFALAHALGLEIPEEGNVGQRIAQVLLGPTMLDAKRRDGRIQPSFGTMRGGAIARELMRPTSQHSNNTTLTYL